MDAIIDFSFHEVTRPSLLAATALPLVIGTTGHTDAEREAILEVVKAQSRSSGLAITP